METTRCRCGKIRDYDEPIIIGTIKHEGLEVENGFCGPADRHTIRNLDMENEKLRRALADAINSPKGVVPVSAQPFYDPANPPRSQHETWSVP